MYKFIELNKDVETVKQEIPNWVEFVILDIKKTLLDGYLHLEQIIKEKPNISEEELYKESGNLGKIILLGAKSNHDIDILTGLIWRNFFIKWFVARYQRPYYYDHYVELREVIEKYFDEPFY